MIPTAALAAQPGDFGWFEEHLLSLFDAAPSFGPLATAALVLGALVVGVAHAIGPGHGKAVVVGYLAGGQGRPRDAIALAGVVSVMHTGSVLAVGFALFAAMRTAEGGQVTFLDDAGAWLRLVAGGLIAAVGAGMLVRERRRAAAVAAPAIQHAGEHGGGVGGGVGAGVGGGVGGERGIGRGGHEQTAAGPGHSHGLERLPSEVSPLSRRGVLLIGASGGLLPSPAAFLVVATGLFTGNLLLAVALVGAFSLGLAVAIGAVGLAAIWGRERLLERMERHGTAHRLGHWIPTGSAVLVVGAGAVTLAAGLTRLL